MKKAAPAIPLLEPSVYKMLQHPVRQGIIIRTGERPWSPSELARDLEKTIKQVCEQVNILLTADPPLLELVETRRTGKGGPPARFYRAMTRVTLGAADWERLSRLERGNQTAEITRQLHGEWLESIEAGTFYEDPEHALMRTAMNLDREGMGEIADLLIETQGRFADVEKRSAERSEQNGERPRRVITGLASFQAAPPN